MNPVDNQTLLNQLKWRYATKAFDTARKVSADDWNTLEQVLILSPSSFGLQPWHFTIITSQTVKDSLVPASYGQAQVAQASHLVVFSLKKGLNDAHVEKHIQRISQVRGVPAEKLAGYKGVMIGTLSRLTPEAVDAWSTKQSYIAMGMLLASAAMLGIDAAPMEGIIPAKYNEILGLDAQGLSALAVVALGYRSAEDASANHPKVRFETEDLITHVK